MSDVMMPRLDGLGLLRRLRADPRFKTLPVVLVSARTGQEASIEGLHEGADDYVCKPFSALELIARVRPQVQLSKVRRALADELSQANLE
ncbi:MAG: response regulator [Myxococcales bacterium]|nr:response regulator [Myxococcales bacterium]